METGFEMAEEGNRMHELGESRMIGQGSSAGFQGIGVDHSEEDLAREDLIDTEVSNLYSGD